MAKTAPYKRKLSSLFVTKAKATARTYLVWDTYQRGLALRVEPTGYKSFKAIYRFNNRSRWYHIDK